MDSTPPRASAHGRPGGRLRAGALPAALLLGSLLVAAAAWTILSGPVGAQRWPQLTSPGAGASAAPSAPGVATNTPVLVTAVHIDAQANRTPTIQWSTTQPARGMVTLRSLTGSTVTLRANDLARSHTLPARGLPRGAWYDATITPDGGPSATSFVNAQAAPTFAVADADLHKLFDFADLQDGLVSVDHTAGLYGSTALKVVAGAGPRPRFRLEQSAGPVTPAQPWSGAVAARAAKAATVQLTLRFLDRAGATVGETAAPSVTLTPTAWTRLAIDGVPAPAGAASVLLVFAQSPGSTVWWDGALLEQATRSSQFFLASVADQGAPDGQADQLTFATTPTYPVAIKPTASTNRSVGIDWTGAGAQADATIAYGPSLATARVLRVHRVGAQGSALLTPGGGPLHVWISEQGSQGAGAGEALIPVPAPLALRYSVAAPAGPGKLTVQFTTTAPADMTLTVSGLASAVSAPAPLAYTSDDKTVHRFTVAVPPGEQRQYAATAAYPGTTEVAFRQAGVLATPTDHVGIGFLADVRYAATDGTASMTQLARLRPDLVILGGDAVNMQDEPAVDQTYVTARQKWASLLADLGRLLPDAPVLSTLGNHEGAEHAAVRQGWDDSLPMPRQPDGPSYYSTSWGPAHIALLDDETDGPEGNLSPLQLQWLDQDLAKAAEPVKIVVLHRQAIGGDTGPFPELLYTTAGQPYPVAGPYWTVEQAAQLHAIALKRGVTLVLSGHRHAYNRVIKDGVTYITTGPASEQGMLSASPPSTPAFVTRAYVNTVGDAGSLPAALGKNGGVYLDIRGTQVQVTAFDATGAVYDRATVQAR